jgi:predicted dehydrogenase
MTELPDPGVAVIGTGFMGTAHTEALRRLGFTVRGIAGRTAESATEAAATLGIPVGYPSVDALLADDSVGAVHVTSPNDVHAAQVEAALRAGKHVVCEKPLGVSSAETAALVALAGRAGVVAATCFNIRFYPHNQNAAGLVRQGTVGTPRFVTGGYHQDWLLRETDWNWRLVAARQGRLRAVADIGSHWLDLVRFVTGSEVEAVCADLHTFVPVRDHPVGEVKTFAAQTVRPGEQQESQRVRERMESDDAAGILLRFAGGARGVCSVSQVSAGRKNRIHWQLDGSESSLAWTGEDPEYLWVGHRGRPNEIVQKDASLMSPWGAAATGYPAGHVEGYPDTFKALFAAVYADIAAGGPGAGSSTGSPAYPTFADGHDAVLVTEAVAESARTGTWVDVARAPATTGTRPTSTVRSPVEDSR